MFKFRKARNTDIEFLVNLRKATMHQHLLNTGIKFREKDHLDRILYEFECSKIIIVGGVKAGLLKVDRSKNPWKLIQIQLALEVQGRGVGKKIVQNLISEANNIGINIELSVLRENPRARKLYESCGFSVVNEKKYGYIMRTNT